MVLLNKIIMITGLILLQGNPVSDQEVIVISGDEIISQCLSRQDGAFNCSASGLDETKKNYVLAKVKSESWVSIYYQEISSSSPVTININSEDFFNVKLNIVKENRVPEELNIFVQPEQIEGVPEETRSFFNKRNNKSKSSYFYKFPTNKEEINLKLRKGTYHIGGDFLTPDVPKFLRQPNFVVNKIEQHPNCNTLEGNIYLGFKVVVNGETTLDLFLEGDPTN